MAKKYIDAEAFKRRILSYGIVHEGDRIPIPFYKHYFADAFVAILRWVCEEVDDTPAADVVLRVERGHRPSDDLVKVVRCRECRYKEEEQPGMVYCPNTVGGWVDEDWFCAGGEKE